MHSEVGSSWRFTTCAKLGYTVHVGRWALASTARIDVRHAVVDVGIPSLTDAEQEPIARSGRSSHAMGQTLSLVRGQTAAPLTEILCCSNPASLWPQTNEKCFPPTQSRKETTELLGSSSGGLSVWNCCSCRGELGRVGWGFGPATMCQIPGTGVWQGHPSDTHGIIFRCSSR